MHFVAHATMFFKRARSHNQMGNPSGRVGRLRWSYGNMLRAQRNLRSQFRVRSGQAAHFCTWPRNYCTFVCVFFNRKPPKRSQNVWVCMCSNPFLYTLAWFAPPLEVHALSQISTSNSFHNQGGRHCPWPNATP